MKLVITPRAQAQIDHQFAYGIERHGLKTAQRTFTRVETFLRDVVLTYPRTGAALPLANLYESIIPRTPFVVIYRVDDSIETVHIVGFFHHAQEREGFTPEA
ncbi:MAG: type II toxin-antitoxin system RelE/ParE family toxin [Hyphomicrobium sp.]